MFPYWNNYCFTKNINFHFCFFILKTNKVLIVSGFFFNTVLNKHSLKSIWVKFYCYSPFSKIGFFSIVGFIIFNLLTSLFVGLNNDRESFLATVEVNSTVNNSTPLTGEVFTYTIQYSCASLTENCEGVVITNPLPPEVEYVGITGSIHTTNESYNGATRTVTFTLVDPLLAGTSGQVQLRVRFPNGSTSNGTVASNTATITSTNAVTDNSTINATAVAAANPILEKEFVHGGGAGTYTTYQFKFCNDNYSETDTDGTLDLNNIIIVDTLPVGSVYVQTNTGNGTSASYDPISHTVTVTKAILIPGECMWPKVTVEYPDPPFSVGTTVDNTAYFTFTPQGEPTQTIPSTSTIILTARSFFAETDKFISHSTATIGGTGTYYIDSNVSGTEDLNDFCVNDTIPAGIEITGFSAGGWYYGGLTGIEDRVNIYYTTNLNGPTLVPGSPFSIWQPESYIQSNGDLGLVTGGPEYITSINWCFGDVPAGFANYDPMEMWYEVRNTATPGVITNCADLSTSTPGVFASEDCADLTINALTSGANLNPIKEKLPGGYLDQGDIFTFQIAIRNETGTADSLENPIAYDLLPEGVTYVPGTWSLPSWGNNLGFPPPTFTIISDYKGTNREFLRWEWSGASAIKIPPSERVVIDFDVEITNIALGGAPAFINYTYIQTPTPYDCWGNTEDADIYDFDEDGDITELLCGGTRSVYVREIVSLESEKLVKGQLDTTWTKYPGIGYTVPGGVSDYQLIVRNKGNMQLDSVIVIDILPFVGDRGVISPSNRDSRWSPNLVGPVSAPAGVTVFYSTEGNPCRSNEGISPTGPASCTTANWSTTPPTNITTVKSLKFEFGATVLNPQDSFILEWPMRAPVNALATIGLQPDSVAWNSFGFIGQRVDNSEYLLPAEPVKVGITMNTEVPAVIGDFVWIDDNQNGIQNGGELGYDGMRVELFKDDGDGISNPAIDSFVNFTVTANGGYYLFPYLPSGDYFLVFFKPAPFGITTPDAGGNDAVDSDGVLMNYNGFTVAVTPVTNLSGIEYDLDWDLGIYPNGLAAIGNYVWADSNNDGVQNESSSNGVNGVTINLYNNINPWAILDTRVTANDFNGNPGYYLFDQLNAGDYFIEFVLPSSTTFSPLGSNGSSDPQDSDANTTNGRTEVFSLAANVYDDTWDAGLILPSTEACDNGIDDDMDGLADCLDPECPCYNPFSCDADIYMAYANGFSDPSTFSTLNTSAFPLAFDALGSVTYNVNAMGYRIQDDFIYGIELGTNELVRIGADGVGYNLGTVLGLPEPVNSVEVYDAGDVFPDGYLYVRITLSHTEIYQIDVSSIPARLVAIHNLNQAIHLSDFAYNIADDKAYGIGDNGTKYMIDPSNWTVTTVGSSTSPASYGAAYTDNIGQVYIYRNNTGTLFRVDFGLNGTGTGDMTSIANAPQVYYNDGASCRGSIFFPEICGNGFDDDGDGDTDEGCVEISGTVFEDINFGGGDGRNYAEANSSAQSSGWSSNAIQVPNARVELYDNAGDFVASTNTDSNGEYLFTNLSSGNYSVRVVNSTINSNRASNSTGETIIPVQTYRTDNITAIINEVGGASPSLIDANANTTSANISTLSTATTTAQSLTSITLAAADVSDIDFGFNFDVVVNTNDIGQGSLRQFILNSNELDNTNLDQEDNPTNGVSFPKDAGWETSIFMIPGGGIHQITIVSAFDYLEDEYTHITGYTQSGALQGTINGRTLVVELIGFSSSYIVGIRINTSHIQVSGLSIHSFSRGMTSTQNNATNSFVWGNYIGVKPDGVSTVSNTGTGIRFEDINDSFIGTNGDNNNDVNEGNLISGNGFDGASIKATSNVLIAGNYIGTDKTGIVDHGNRYKGIFVIDATAANYIGFKDDLTNTDASAFRNILSGNGNDGIRLSGSSNQVISGNYLGTDVTGTVAITNSNYGIQIQGDANNNIIGTNSNGDDDIKERNIISGNGTGMRFLGTSTGVGNRIAGNFIGTDVSGNNPLPNLNHGISLEGDNTGTIIGTNGDNINDSVEGNVISANDEDGIRHGMSYAIVAGNNIGVGYDGVTALGNGSRGILVTLDASNNVFGFSPTMTNSDELIVGNKIMHNSGSGIAISDSGTQNRMSRNQWVNNSLGIDLDYDGVSANDNGDGDTGPNNMLNFPVLESAQVIGTNLIVIGFAPAGSEIEFFIADAGPSPDPLDIGYTSSFGEGAVYLFSANEGSANDTDGTIANYTNDGTGSSSTKTQNRFEITIDTAGFNLDIGINITSTATDVNNNTSEFSGWTSVEYIEVCNDGIDNDGDGLVDCSDCEDCFDSVDCDDSDNDGIGDFCDLDDDNDGIPDEAECPDLDFDYDSGQLSALNVSGGLDVDGDQILNIGDYLLIDDAITDNGITYDAVVEITGMNSGDGTWALIYSIPRIFNRIRIKRSNIKLDPWISYTMTFVQDGSATTLSPSGTAVMVPYVKLAQGDLDGRSITNRVSEVGGINTSTGDTPYQISVGSILNINGFINITDPVGYNTHRGTLPVPISPDGSLDSAFAIQYYFTNVTAVDLIFGATSDTDFTDSRTQLLSLNSFDCDCDGDNVPNHLDLDSDNDGLLDVYEAGHSSITVDVNGRINGADTGSGDNGIFDALETSTESGIINYTISDSETTPDGTYDICEIDSDGDGCFDAQEEDVIDGDGDGIAGDGMPMVNPINGLVTTNTYSPPPNNHWQNPLIGPCLTEICTDGIDNDGDGNADYLDDECDCPVGFSNGFNIDFGSGVAISGSGLNLGDQILYSNVGRIGNQSVDIRATVSNLTNISSLLDHGNNSGGVLLPSVRVSVGTFFSAAIQYEIFESGTNTPISSSFEIEIVDLDLLPTNRTESIIVSQSEVDLYTLYNPTNVSTSFTGGNITFSGTTNQSGSDPEGAIKLTYTDVNEFVVTYRMEQMVAGSNAGSAGFGLNGNNIQFFTDCMNEICNDSFDNDGDGLTDCDDPDCGPVANNTTLTTCDNSNGSGSGTFFLPNASTAVSGGNSSASVSYHLQLTEAQNGINQLPNSFIFSNATIYARMEIDSSGCYDTAEITLTVSGTCTEDCSDGIDNDGDGLIDCFDCDECGTFAGCGDNDGDGIGDFCDLDDDNDGIPDTEECPNFVYGPELVINGDFENAYANWTSDFNRGWNNYLPTSDGCPQQGWIAISSCATINGSCPTYYNYYGSTPDGSIVIMDPYGTGANVVATTNCNNSSGVCLAEILPDHTTGTGFSLYVDPSQLPGKSYWKQQVTVEANKNYEFSAWIMVIEEDPNLQFKINGATLTAGFNLDRQTGGSDGPDIWQQFAASWYSGPTSGSVSIELVNLTAGCAGNDIRLDDVSLREVIRDCDCDGDGVDNHLDLDSDNDGLLDVEEAGHFAYDGNHDGIIDLALLNVGTNGLYDSLETVADNGILTYIAADSETIPDGILDICELDSDGDGCLDVDEEDISDPDNDGIAGTGVPTVNPANGLITTIVYADPPNGNWQNPLIGPCLSEVCDDGLDNDTDGDTDCDDPDCQVIAEINNGGGCSPSGVNFMASDAGPGISYTWSFGTNATPATATGLGPHTIDFSNCGNQQIVLSVSTAACTFTDSLIYSTRDSIIPVFTSGIIPADITISCSDPIPGAPVVTATDDCSTPTVTFSEIDNQSADLCGQNNYTIVRTWGATDFCGNSIQESQTITIEDPTFSCVGSGVIGGIAFLDPNNNGIIDDGLDGVQGLDVFLYEDNGGASTFVAQTVTDVDGRYSFSSGVTSGAAYRVEFVRPGGMIENFTRHGSDNGTNVQFVNAPSCTVNVGLADPAEYCEVQPFMYVPCYSFGAAENNPIDAIVGLPLNPSTGPSENGVIGGTVKHLANAEHVGSIYGMAYSKSKEMLYGAAFMKRHVGFGPGGTGAIYQIDPNATSPGASVLVDLNVVFGANTAGADPHPYGDTGTCLGCITSPGTPDNFNCWQYDTLAWDAVGTISLGDIDASDDGEELFVMNLADKMLYRIDIDNPTAAIRYAFPEGDITCMSGGEIRPFAVEFENNKVYVGAVCDQNSEDIAMLYVYELDLATSNWERVLEANYQRTGGTANDRFYPWIPFDTWGPGGSITYRNSNHSILSDISFDGNAMVLGIRDLTGDKFGSEAGRPDRGCDTWFYTSGGDIFRAGYNSSTNQYEMEHDATVNGITTAGLNSGYGLGNGYGTVGSNYYYQDIAPNGASQISLGGLAQLPNGAIYTSAYDVMGLFDFGIAAYDNQTGARAQSYQMATNTNNLTGFGKANGLGDLEFGCEDAPVEIGNRIWYDVNANGIQDVTEPGILGVTVNLYNSSGDLVGSQITDVSGEYYFSDITLGDSTLRSNDDYYVSIGGPEYNPLNQVLMDTLFLTLPNIGQAPNNDINDSDATIGTVSDPAWVLDHPFVFAQTSDQGTSDHNFDIGFRDCLPPEIVGVPNDTLVECQNVPDAPIIGTEIIGLSDCYNVNLTLTIDTIGQSCTHGYTLIRIWTAEDEIGQITRDSQQIIVQDNTAPDINGVPADTIVNCDEVPLPVVVTIVDNCDPSTTNTFNEAIVYHPDNNWKSGANCSILYTINAGVFDDKGTPSTADDEMSFTLTVIGQNTGTGWSANINGTSINGNYYQSYVLGPILSGGSILNFSIIDDNDGTCNFNVTINSSDF